jgi:D-glycero-alpha-D-manno-heptose-7-phosphate kinase
MEPVLQERTGGVHSSPHMNDTSNHPRRIINSVAPIRICDNGGWTDTWFAGRGKIFNIAVYPYAEVQVEVTRYEGEGRQIVIHAENYGERYVRDPDKQGWDRHPLLEAAPAGASTGTSAAVTVALIGALDQLTPGRLSLHEIAYTAHAVEVEMLKQQCGIQDQLCSAFGGINFIDMHHYPIATVSPIHVPNSIWWELERRLTLIFLGRSHNSSDVHLRVINELNNEGPDARKLEDLRLTAEKSRDALSAGDFQAFGKAMIENTEAQGRLHPDLISPRASRVIEIARAHGAIGWKVNGAGGEGGSVTILTNHISSVKRRMIKEIEEEDSSFRNIPIYLSRFGLRTWQEVLHEEAASPSH